jgi:hypothetical protein
LSTSPPEREASTRRRSGAGDLDSRREIPSAQCARPSLELGALDGVGGERDRALVGAGGVARAAQQLGVAACGGW